MKDDAKHLCSKCGSKPRNAVMCAECDKVKILCDVYTNTWCEITYAISSYSVRNVKQMIKLTLVLSVTAGIR